MFHIRETTKYTKHTKDKKRFIPHFRVFRVVRGSSIYKALSSYTMMKIYTFAVSGLRTAGLIGKETAQNQGSLDLLICRFVLVLEAFEPLSNPRTRTSTRTRTIQNPFLGI